MKEIQVAEITHYFNKIGVAVLVLDGELAIGDTIHILGRVTDFTQRVSSMEIEHMQVGSVKPGDDVALKVADYVREGDSVFKVVAELD